MVSPPRCHSLPRGVLPGVSAVKLTESTGVPGGVARPDSAQAFRGPCRDRSARPVEPPLRESLPFPLQPPDASTLPLATPDASSLVQPHGGRPAARSPSARPSWVRRLPSGGPPRFLPPKGGATARRPITPPHLPSPETGRIPAPTGLPLSRAPSRGASPPRSPPEARFFALRDALPKTSLGLNKSLRSLLFWAPVHHTRSAQPSPRLLSPPRPPPPAARSARRPRRAATAAPDRPPSVRGPSAPARSIVPARPYRFSGLTPVLPPLLPFAPSPLLI